MKNTNNVDTQEFISIVNKLRKANRDKWYIWAGVVNGKTVRINGFNTWLRSFYVDGINQNTLMDISVADFMDTLRTGVS